SRACERVPGWLRAPTAHHDVRGQETAVTHRPERLPLPAGQTVDYLGGHRRRHCRDDVPRPHLAGFALTVDLDGVAAVRSADGPHLRLQRYAVPDRARQSFCE